MSKLFLSHRLDLLAEHLARGLASDGLGVFAPQIIVVPSSSLKAWILIQIADQMKEKGIAGCKAITLEEALETLVDPSGYTEIFCSLFNALSDCQSKEVRSYLRDDTDPSHQRLVELADRLTSLFLRYGRHCPSLFEPVLQHEEWQKRLIQTLFVSGKLRLAAQMPPMRAGSIHCFGFDYLPPSIWKLFNFHSIYLFSPCCHFWEDLCTNRERIRLGRYWKKKGAPEKKQEELDSYLKNGPPLLANWGRAGRETLKVLDSFVEEIEEDYRPFFEVEKDTTLERLRKRILNFSLEKSSHPSDFSIQISKTGSSRLREIEHLRASVMQLVEKEGLLFSDIVVFAPDIHPYASLIQFVFSDIPFRISGLGIGSKSFFYQGMHQLFELDFHSEDLMILFENPSFSRARGWNQEVLEEIRHWISLSRDSQFEARALDWFVYLFPEEKNRISTSQADVLQQVIEIYQSLRVDLASLKQNRTLADWSKWLPLVLKKYFSVDNKDEADAASWSRFQGLMRELMEADREGHLFPFEVIQALLKRSIPQGQIHASHLHAVKFGSIAEGTLSCARALFFIGMDEESFPRRSSSSSLDLCEKIYPFEASDQDRYFLLQALFAAKDFIHFSYAHLSADGNPVNPSPLIEELIQSLDAPIEENGVSLLPKGELSSSKKSFDPEAGNPALKGRVFSNRMLGRMRSSAQLTIPGLKAWVIHWPEGPSLETSEGDLTISLSDLSSLARHPWAFYLQKEFGIRFDGQEEVLSFSRQKARLLRANLQTPHKDLLPEELPAGICGEALKIGLEEVKEKWADLLRHWDVFVEPASLRVVSREKRKSEKGWDLPALELEVSGRRVKLVGALKTFSTKGFIHAGNDSLEGLLSLWPECLAALVASDKREIYCLKSGKIRTVDQPEVALKAFISYYFLAKRAPSPLLADWADALLRKGPLEWEKKISDTALGKSVWFEDPVWEWVRTRVDHPVSALSFERWSPILRKHFSELMAIYEGRVAPV